MTVPIEPGEKTDLMRKLKLTQKLMLALPIGAGMEAAKTAAYEYSGSEQARKYSEGRQTVDNLASWVKGMANAGTKQFEAVLAVDEIVKHTFGEQTNLFVEQQSDSQRIGLLLFFSLRYSVQLLKPYTRGRRDFTEPEMQELASRASQEFGPKMELPPDCYEELKRGLLCGLRDPDRIALY